MQRKMGLGVLWGLWVVAIVGCSSGGGGGGGGTTGGLPTGQIASTARYTLRGNLLGGAQAHEGSAFRLATAVTGNGTAITLSDGQLVITGNVSTTSGVVPFHISATASSDGSVKSVTMTIGVGTTFTGSGTIAAGNGQIVLTLSNGTTITMDQDGVSKTGGPGNTVRAYTATFTTPRCDGTTPVATGPMLVAFLADGEVAVVWLATGNLLVATGTRTDTTLSLAAVNLANSNVAAGSATTADAFTNLSLTLTYCDTAGGCTCPPSRGLTATGTAVQTAP